MSPREANLLWLRDILEQLTTSQKQLEWAEDTESINLLTDTMQRDLERCQQLCQALRQRQRCRVVA